MSAVSSALLNTEHAPGRAPGRVKLALLHHLGANAAVCGDGLKGGDEKCADHLVETEGEAGGSAESYRVVGRVALKRYRRSIANRHSFLSRINGDRQMRLLTQTCLSTP